jgi:small subunit ribosomal protein S17
MSKRTITGVVSSVAGAKTIVITRVSRETHPLYGKKYTVSRKFHAHDEKSEAKVGDTVIIEETRPISATKTWTLIKIVEKGREKFELKKTNVEEEAEAKVAEKAARKAAEKAEAEEAEK